MTQPYTEKSSVHARNCSTTIRVTREPVQSVEGPWSTSTSSIQSQGSIGLLDGDV